MTLSQQEPANFMEWLILHSNTSPELCKIQLPIYAAKLKGFD